MNQEIFFRRYILPEIFWLICQKGKERYYGGDN